MGLMLNRRRVMGGNNLPYDAEIEYLESTGTQWIATMIQPKIGDIYRIDATFQFSQGAISDTWLTGWYINQDMSSLFGTARGYIYFTYNVDGNITKTDKDLYEKHRCRYNYDGIYIDDQPLTTSVNNTPLTSVPNMPRGLSIFCRYYNGYGQHIKAKVYHFIIQLNNEIVFNGIPVRVGNVGYMYDKVSKQLFGNAGTGDFILGFDKGVVPNYTEIEYLESDGTQYIETSYVLKANDVIEYVVCNTTSDFTENKGWGTGNYDTNGYDLGGGLRYNAGQIMYWYWGNNYSFSPNLNSTTPYNYYHEEVHFSAPQGYVQLEDLTTGQVYNITGIVLSTFPTLSVHIFKANGSYPYWGKKRFKYFRITNNNTPILDLIPVRVNNKGYMYDKVSGQFFDNAGTGSFILGPDKDSTVRITQQQREMYGE